MILIDVFEEGYRSEGEVYNSATNTSSHAYYAPELQTVLEQYRSLASDPGTLNRFVKKRQELANELMKVRKS